jgi:hypothetical protein
MSAITSCLCQLRKICNITVESRTEAARGEPKDMHSQQLEYLSVGACSLEEVVSKNQIKYFSPTAAQYIMMFVA